MTWGRDVCQNYNTARTRQWDISFVIAGFGPGMTWGRDVCHPYRADIRNVPKSCPNVPLCFPFLVVADDDDFGFKVNAELGFDGGLDRGDQV